MHLRSMRFLSRTAAALALAAATAPLSLAPVYAEEGSGDAVVVVDCSDPGLADSVAAAGEAAAAAKAAYRDLLGPDAREVKEQRAEARAAAKEARKALRHSTDKAAAKAARAELRAAEKTLRASRKQAVKALQAERRAAKASWHEAKDAHHALLEAVEACAESDDTDGDPTS